MCKHLYILTFGIIEIQYLIILSSKKQRNCTQLGIQGLFETSSLSCFQLTSILKQKQERFLCKLYYLEIVEREDRNGSFRLMLYLPGL